MSIIINSGIYINYFNKDEKEIELLNEVYNNNIQGVYSILNEASSNYVTLDINKKNQYGCFPLLWAAEKNNVEMVKLIIGYANNNKIILDVNDKETTYWSYPLYHAASNVNYDIVKLLIDYANQNNIILTMDNNIKGKNPLTWAVALNNVNIVRLLLDYVNKNNTKLELREMILDSTIFEYRTREKDCVNNVAEIKPEIIRLMDDSRKKQKLNVIFNQYSPLLKVFQDISISSTNPYMSSSTQYAYPTMTSYSYPYPYPSPYSSPVSYVSYPPPGISYSSLPVTGTGSFDLSATNKEKIEKEKKEKERLEREKREKEEREKEERERKERERKERERKERERIERERSTSNNSNNNNNNNNITYPETPTLVIATNDYDGDSRYDHLDIKKDEFLIVTDWNSGEKGWVYGHRKNNPREKGIFPEIFIKVCNDENNGNNENEGKNVLKNKITPEYKIRFENKINRLRSLNEMQIVNAAIGIEVSRDNLFEDAFNSIMSMSPQNFKKNLRIKFTGEMGIDAGGLLRDFFYQISKIIGDPSYSLFKYAHDGSYELEINPIFSTIEPNYLQYYRFIGRIIGLAIFNKQYLSISFILLLYKRILNKPLEFSDLEYVDSDLFKNLQYLKNNDGAEYLCLTFSLDTEDSFGNRKTIELKPNGANIDVTDDNKNEYIDLVVKNKLTESNDKEELNALKQGFYEILPQRIGSLLDEIDLKYLISGLSVIDVDDWENNTDYEGYEKTDITIINFWKCVRKFSYDNQIKLLIFATGNSQVPVTGFKDLQGSGRIQHFKLKKIGTEDDLPKSHTCFNRIDLPPYTSLTIMRQKLLLAISEGMGGFSME